jgi:glycerol kinase
MKYILAIDQGTTGSRAIVYDKSGSVKAKAYNEFPQHFPKPGWVEHDPKDIWQSVLKSINQALAGLPKNSIAAVGITNQRETTVIWNRRTGKPIYNAIVWQCRRTAERCAKIPPALRRHIADTTGLAADAYFSASKIEWILNKVPGARERAKRGELLFGTTDSWVLWNLTGGKVHATDYTNVSRTMLFDIRKLQWDARLLEFFNVPQALLPQVKPSSGVFGETVNLGNLPAGIPVCGIAGDQQAALYGQACFEPGELKNTYGTGGFLLLNTGGRAIKSRNGLLTTICCDAHGKPAYALEGSVFIAGAAIQWLRDGIKILDNAPQSEALAASLPDNEGVYLVPAFVGLGAPHWKPDARGAIFGLTRGTTRAHFARAAIEAMCYQTKDVIDAMAKDSGLHPRELRVDGGACANNLLCQFQSDILRVKVVRPQVIETTSLGAAYLAGLCAGYWKNPGEIKRCWRREHVFSPKMPLAKAHANCAGWEKALRQLI